MNMSYVSPFFARQVMRQNDFEIYHRFDPASGHIEPHSHDFYEIYFPRTEGLEFVIDGHRYRVGPGRLLLIAPGQVHFSCVPEKGMTVERFVLWLDPSFVESLTGLLPRFRNLLGDGLKGRNLIVPDPETYELMIGLLFSLLHEKQLNDLDSSTLNRLVVAQLLVHISRVLSREPGTMTGRAARRYGDIQRVYEYISAHLQDRLSVTELAETFFMDKNTLTRQFKQVTGMTPAECVRRMRLDAAYTMISHGTSASDACQECGFSDYSAFYRAFRQAFGISPSACASLPESGVRLHRET